MDDLDKFNEIDEWEFGKQRLCRDCVYSHISWFDWIFGNRYEFAKCHYKPYKFDDGVESLVGGKSKRYEEYSYCSTERKGIWKDIDPSRECGVIGRYWKPKRRYRSS